MQGAQEMPAATGAMTKLQENTGFARQVLAAQKEDVWNDV